MATVDGKKTGGRQKGTPNKKTITQTQGLNFDPLVEGIALYNQGELTTDQQITLVKILLPYFHSQRKAVEISTNKECEPNIVFAVKGIKLEDI